MATAQKKISGFKGFKRTNDNAIRCINYTFRKNLAVHSIPRGIEINVCSTGFHFCKTLRKVINYYPLEAHHSYHRVKGYGEVSSDNYDKLAVRHLEIGDRLSFEEILAELKGKIHFEGKIKTSNNFWDGKQYRCVKTNRNLNFAFKQTKYIRIYSGVGTFSSEENVLIFSHMVYDDCSQYRKYYCVCFGKKPVNYSKIFNK